MSFDMAQKLDATATGRLGPRPDKRMGVVFDLTFAELVQTSVLHRRDPEIRPP